MRYEYRHFPASKRAIDRAVDGIRYALDSFVMIRDEIPSGHPDKAWARYIGKELEASLNHLIDAKAEAGKVE